ncbi:hypothetical protein K438DRAFT_1796200, partial [Mycena galopus ATCC 62051]
ALLKPMASNAYACVLMTHILTMLNALDAATATTLPVLTPRLSPASARLSGAFEMPPKSTPPLPHPHLSRPPRRRLRQRPALDCAIPRSANQIPA